MPKIRGVHPDFWTDENVVELSPFARLLWIGLWNHACDNGHLQDKSKQIKMRVLPYDDVNCADLLREIEAQELVERSDGWITVPNLSHHQKPHKSWWTTCEKPGCVLPEGTSHAPSNRGATVAKRGRNRSATADVDVDVEGDGELKVSKNLRASALSETDRFDEFWNTYSHKIGRKKAETAYAAAVKKPGVTPALLISAASSYISFQTAEGKHPQYTKHPATWLNGEHWTDERTGRTTPMTNTQRHIALAQQLAADEHRQIEGPR